MCQVSSSAWTAQNHRPQMPQWDVAVESQGSAMGETASQDHSRLRVSVWLDCCNISPPRAGSIHLAVVAEFQWEVTLSLEQSLTVVNSERLLSAMSSQPLRMANFCKVR